MGIKTKVWDIVGLVNDGDFVPSLEDNIRIRDAMDILITDRDQSEVSNQVKQVLRHLCIKG